MENHKKKLLRMLARAWNNLETCYIESVLHENLVYESQWVFLPIQGKKEVLRHIQKKFSTIRKEMSMREMIVTAELAFHPRCASGQIIVLTQITEEGINQVSLLITVEDEKIRRIDVCFIPDPTEALFTGDVPR